MFAPYIFLLLLLVPPSGWTQTSLYSLPSDTGKAELDSPAVKPRFLNDSVLVDIRSRIRTVVAWPFERVVQPVFGFILYPLRPPLEYILDENLVDRGVDLVTFGSQRSGMVYPTKLLRGGTDNSIGVSYRHRHVFRQHDFISASYGYFVNGDRSFSASYRMNQILSTQLFGWVSFNFEEDSDATFRVPDQNPNFLYADSSWALRVGTGNPIKGNWSWGYHTGLERNIFDLPVVRDTLVRPGHVFDVFSRGMYQHFDVIPLGLTLIHDSRDATAAPTSGSVVRFNYEYAFVSNYRGRNIDNLRSNSLDHNYQAVQLILQHYLLLGRKRFALTNTEIRSNQKYFTDFNLDRALEMFRPGQLRETLLERKVLVFQFRARQMWEVEEGGAPFTAYSALGNNTPLRGYGGVYRYDHNIMGVSMEYRWPILRLVDGVFFNEYGMHGRSWNDPRWGSLVNSWGFGMQMRKPDFFICRLQFGFHGMQGVQLILTIRPTY